MRERTLPDPGNAVYGMTRPTAADLRGSIANVYRHATGGIWTKLVADAGVADVNHPAAAERLINAARDSDDSVLALCGRAQHIRAVTHHHLSSLRDIVGAAAR